MRKMGAYIRDLPYDKLYRERGPYVCAQDYAEGMIKTDKPCADEPHCKQRRCGAALKKYRRDEPHDEAIERFSDRNADIFPYPGAEYPLHLLAQFDHAQKKKGETCQKKEYILGHSCLRDLASVRYVLIKGKKHYRRPVII